MITLVIGTNRTDSLSEIVALYYQKILRDKQVESQIIHLADLPKDFVFTALYENSGKNARFNLLREAVIDASKLIFIVPEYNGSFPGVLKSFIDGLPYPSAFENKWIALVGLSSGVQGGALALSHLADVFSYLNANLIGLRVRLTQIEKNLHNGQITNPLYHTLLERQAEKVIAL